MTNFFEWVKSFKAFFIAMAVVFCLMMAWNVANSVSEGFKCFFGDCKSEMAKKIIEQEARIGQLEKALEDAKRTAALVDGNKKDNSVAVAQMCEEKKENATRAQSIIEKAKQDSKPKPVTVAKPKPPTPAGENPVIVVEEEKPVYVGTTFDEVPEFTAEAIIEGLWSMHCGGKHNVCKKVS